MEQYFPLMTEEYRQKHYKNGVFDRIHRNTSTVSVLVYLFMGAVFLGGVYGTWWTLTHLEAFREADLTVFSYVMAAFCILFAVIGLACIVISVRRQLQGAEQLKEAAAKAHGYTVADMEEFERQALGTNSHVLCLIDPVKKTIQGQEDGILTRDYIALSLHQAENILKLSDVTTACLLQQVVKVGKGTNRMGVPYLCVGLMGKDGASVVAECSKESGKALIELLKERVPGLDTADDKILESSEYDDLWASKYGKKASKKASEEK